MLGTFTLHKSKDQFAIVNEDHDESGEHYFVDKKGQVLYADEGTFEPAFPQYEPLPEIDGWELLETSTSND